MRLLYWMGREGFGRGEFPLMRSGWWLGGERRGRLGLMLKKVREELRLRVLLLLRRGSCTGGGKDLLFQGYGMKDLRGW